MATILVQNKKGKFRLWNNTVDAFVSPLVKREEMISWLNVAEDHTIQDAITRVDRIDYDKDHLEWLDVHFDSKYDSLIRRHRSLHGSLRRGYL